MMVAASAAVFVLAAHTLAARTTSVRTFASDGSSNGSPSWTSEDDLGTQSAGAVAMSTAADGGRETD